MSIATEEAHGAIVDAAVKQFAAHDLSKLVDETLDDILRMSSRSTQSGICSVEQVMPHLLRTDDLGEVVYAHNANYFDTEDAADGLSKEQLTSSSFTALTRILMRPKMSSVNVDNGTVAAQASNEEHYSSTQTYTEVFESQLSC